MLVWSKYMAAIMGYMLASQSQFEMEQQKQYLENLCDFARSVHADVSAQQQPAAEEPASASQSAYGIWEPNK